MSQSKYFKRLKKEVEAMSPYVRFRRIKYGFWRIFIKHAYIGECYENMPHRGYDYDFENPLFRSRKYLEEREDPNEVTRLVKNFVEGYVDSYDRLRTRIYMYKNDKEFRNTADTSYKFVRLK